MPEMIHELARLVYKEDPQLADALARYTHTNLIALGLARVANGELEPVRR